MTAVLLFVRNSRFAQFAIAAALVLALMAAAAAMWRSHNAHIAEQAVALDRSDITAEVSNRVIAADQAATANAVERDAIADTNDKELTHEADRTDGNAVVFVLERMRRQQTAGRR